MQTMTASSRKDVPVRPVLLILCLAILLRIMGCLNTAIINSDGAIYIDQARMIYYGLWDQIVSHDNRLLKP